MIIPQYGTNQVYAASFLSLSLLDGEVQRSTAGSIQQQCSIQVLHNSLSRSLEDIFEYIVYIILTNMPCYYPMHVSIILALHYQKEEEMMKYIQDLEPSIKAVLHADQGITNAEKEAEGMLSLRAPTQTCVNILFLYLRCRLLNTMTYGFLPSLELMTIS